MGKERREKSVLIGVLCAVILFMAIGFASIGAQLKIEGGASIGETWNVQITGISKKSATAGVVETTNFPTFSATTASFDVQLTEPGDNAVYTVTVSNLGSIDAKLNLITELEQADGSAAIKYTLIPAEGSEQGTSLAHGETDTFDVKVEYLSTAVGENAPSADASKSYTVTLDYIQDTTNGTGA